MHRAISILVSLFFISCSQSKLQLDLEELYRLSKEREIEYSVEIVDTLDQSQLSIDDIYTQLQEALGEEEPVLVMPKFNYLEKFRLQFPYTLMFDKKGRQVSSNICFAHYPNPLEKSTLQYDSPRLLNSEITLSEFLLRMDTIIGDICGEDVVYDFYLFYAWGHSREGDLPRMQAEMHQNLAKQIPNFRHKIKLITLYVGNHSGFNMNQQDFNDYFKLPKIEQQ